MREKKIDFMIVVPAFLKLLKNTIEADIRSLSTEEKLLFERSYAAAEYITDFNIKRQLFRSILAKFEVLLRFYYRWSSVRSNSW